MEALRDVKEGTVQFTTILSTVVDDLDTNRYFFMWARAKFIYIG